MRPLLLTLRTVMLVLCNPEVQDTRTERQVGLWSGSAAPCTGSQQPAARGCTRAQRARMGACPPACPLGPRRMHAHTRRWPSTWPTACCSGCGRTWCCTWAACTPGSSPPQPRCPTSRWTLARRPWMPCCPLWSVTGGWQRRLRARAGRRWRCVCVCVRGEGRQVLAILQYCAFSQAYQAPHVARSQPVPPPSVVCVAPLARTPVPITSSHVASSPPSTATARLGWPGAAAGVAAVHAHGGAVGARCGHGGPADTAARSSGTARAARNRRWVAGVETPATCSCALGSLAACAWMCMDACTCVLSLLARATGQHLARGCGRQLGSTVAGCARALQAPSLRAPTAPAWPCCCTLRPVAAPGLQRCSCSRTTRCGACAARAPCPALPPPCSTCSWPAGGWCAPTAAACFPVPTPLPRPPTLLPCPPTPLRTGGGPRAASAGGVQRAAPRAAAAPEHGGPRARA